MNAPDARRGDVSGWQPIECDLSGKVSRVHPFVIGRAGEIEDRRPVREEPDMTELERAVEAALWQWFNCDNWPQVKTNSWAIDEMARMRRALSAAYPVLTARIAELERGAAGDAHDAPDAAPTHTDLMLSPEAIDRVLDELGTAAMRDALNRIAALEKMMQQIVGVLEGMTGLKP